MEEDQPEVDQPVSPGLNLDRKLEFPANNSNDDNTSEDNSSIGSDPIGAADPHKKKRNRKSKKVRGRTAGNLSDEGTRRSCFQ